MPFLIPRSKTVQLDGSGNGQVSFEIDNTNVRWIIDTVHVVTVDATGAITSTPVPQAKTYINQVAAQKFAGGTYNGNFDTASGRVIIYTGDLYFVVWTGGVPNSTATATIEGTFDPRGTVLQDN